MIENTIEELVIELLEGQGFDYIYAPKIAYDGDRPERRSYGDVLLLGRLRDAVGRINPGEPDEKILFKFSPSKISSINKDTILVKFRDNLLPKLISGSIRIKRERSKL